MLLAAVYPLTYTHCGCLSDPLNPAADLYIAHRSLRISIHGVGLEMRAHTHICDYCDYSTCKLMDTTTN
jgi:methionine synthase II (cobalamin-independent)